MFSTFTVEPSSGSEKIGLGMTAYGGCIRNEREFNGSLQRVVRYTYDCPSLVTSKRTVDSVDAGKLTDE